jgi:ABC-type dipeptide/oligopeptide/nickel transport system permease component
MKKVSFILFLAMGTQIMNAHPSVASHSHDSIISEWAWLIIPILALGIFGAYYAKKNGKKAS